MVQQIEVAPESLVKRYQDLPDRDLLRVAIGEAFPGRIAVVSSFGAESAIVLSLVAQIDPSVPVIFLDTGKHFPETLDYRDQLIDRFGLTDVRSIEPAAADLAAEDPDGTLWQRNTVRCCELRKVAPLARALEGFDAWVTGRKRFHGALRSYLPRIEFDGERYKVNPIVDWSAEKIEAAFDDLNLPRHPLTDDGFLSIGCAPCTQAPLDDNAVRSGRWAGSGKTECGIHNRPAPPAASAMRRPGAPLPGC
ncbi:phosphoadenylyl-sulfate reductase [Pelagibius sp. Alg239-R121]|uniref:phosphoadenylyl-sulfate reductase n=1 Tax=Pelagibius sp. Alg239-R121 TaxID=2993448 RepID=UPI0024A66C8E|nr:phosphoadenylyl-sulfate reductase [Pelagibius sp. Alg239-R121]